MQTAKQPICLFMNTSRRYVYCGLRIRSLPYIDSAAGLGDPDFYRMEKQTKSRARPATQRLPETELRPGIPA